MIDKNIINIIDEMLKQGHNKRYIAYKLDMPYHKINYIIRVNNLEQKYPSCSELNNLTIKEISIKLNKSIASTRRYCKIHGVIVKKEHNQQYHDIVYDYEHGISQADIARKYNVSRQYVSQIIKGESR